MTGSSFPIEYNIGLDHFMAGQYFEAHEVWEDLWRVTAPSDDKTFYQGCIQLAVALHHLHHNNLTGANNLLKKAADKFCAISGPVRFQFMQAEWEQAAHRIVNAAALFNHSD